MEKKYNQINDQIIPKKNIEKDVDIFRAILDSMESIVFVSDMQTHELIYTNKKLKQTLGYDDSVVLEGQKCWQVIQKNQTGVCSFCTNKRLVHPDGKPDEAYEWEFCNTLNNRWYRIIDKAIEWPDNRIVRLETAFDITDKKEHEKLFREFDKTIETSRKLKSISTFAGGVAHDFNNTLTAIIGNINLAQMGSLDSETQEYLENAEKGVMQAKGISSKLVLFGKGSKPLKEKTDIEILIRQILENNFYPETVIFSFEPESIPVPFYADPDQLKVAIENMLQNSVEAMKGAGKIDIIVRYLDHRPKNPQISIFISDSGCGIPGENLDMVFNPYFTTKHMDNRKSKGLGLSVAWTIITRHGGHINVESTLNKGTIFNIILPVFNQKGLEIKHDKNFEHQAKPVLNKTNIWVLVMDEDELLLDAISQMLRHLGYKTLVASNRNQAIGICKTAKAGDKKIDIALLDFDIRKGQGEFSTMEELKKIDPDIKGVLITEYPDDMDEKEINCYGFTSVLDKPFSIKHLKDKITGILAL
ncbi:hybrid sensor histidine kinase/response regulator [Desulfobacula toluolica]|uniref:histidine kinase n=1 Tax=Desulfobacula toluolica (strain DSM 7467 / Tol2) TaxID=651182 RepID=K0NPR2_DESTT|nr:ATP-binding protein [Desulfobacula toluolica]CCK82128.1 two component system sensor histidine kinase, hybrid [Desulfobacula toluolica Tol2]